MLERRPRRGARVGGATEKFRGRTSWTGPGSVKRGRLFEGGSEFALLRFSMGKVEDWERPRGKRERVGHRLTARFFQFRRSWSERKDQFFARSPPSSLPVNHLCNKVKIIIILLPSCSLKIPEKVLRGGEKGYYFYKNEEQMQDVQIQKGSLIRDCYHYFFLTK